MLRYFLVLVLAIGSAFASASAEAGLAVTAIPGLQGDGPVTVYYPTAAPDQTTRRGPFALQLAPDNAEPRRGNGRLVIVSHGSGGNPWVHADLARRLVEAGFIVAMPQHAGDHAGDPSRPGPESWKKRPAEVSRAIDAVAATARLAALLQLDKVGMYGMSAGGHTALSLAGGQWSPGNFKRHCEANITDDFHTCVGLITRLTGGFFDGLKKQVALGAIRQRFDDDTWQVHTDPRIGAIVAGVPAAADFDTTSLARPNVPLGLVTAGRDKWLVPRFHSDRVLAACKTCELIAHLPEGGHGFLLAPPPPRDRLSELAADLLLEPPSFDRAQLPAVDARIVDFMRRHLLP